eukprot:405728-Lingulodinium_polyedra.AAC.1
MQFFRDGVAQLLASQRGVRGGGVVQIGGCLLGQARAAAGVAGGEGHAQERAPRCRHRGFQGPMVPGGAGGGCRGGDWAAAG